MKLALVFATITALSPPLHAQPVRVIGSDSMVVVAIAWAEKFGSPVEVSGGGSGIGVAALIHGTADVAMVVRELTPEESKSLADQFGAPPVTTVVAHDALAIFVHKDNPAKHTTIPELQGIWFQGGTIDYWKQLGFAQLGSIVPFSRAENTGSYTHFKEAVAGRGAELKLDIATFGSSMEIVEACTKTPASICFAALAYGRPGIRPLAIAKDKEGVAITLTHATVRDGSYPLARKFYLVTTGKADATTKKFVEFVTGPAGQKVAAEHGLVPLAD